MTRIASWFVPVPRSLGIPLLNTTGKPRIGPTEPSAPVPTRCCADPAVSTWLAVQKYLEPRITMSVGGWFLASATAPASAPI